MLWRIARQTLIVLRPRLLLLLLAPGGRGGGGRALPVPAVLYETRLPMSGLLSSAELARISVVRNAFSISRPSRDV